jgi:hypothetical protein
MLLKSSAAAYLQKYRFQSFNKKNQDKVERVKLLPDAITDNEIRTRGALLHASSLYLRERIHCNLMSDMINCVNDGKINSEEIYLQ